MMLAPVGAPPATTRVAEAMSASAHKYNVTHPSIALEYVQLFASLLISLRCMITVLGHLGNTLYRAKR